VHAFDVITVERLYHVLPGLFAILAPGDHLGHNRVVEQMHRAAGIDPAVEADEAALFCFVLVTHISGCGQNHENNSSNAGTNPTGALSGSRRVFRSGSWYNAARICRAAYRNGFEPGGRNSYPGFRLALTPGQPSESGNYAQSQGRKGTGNFDWF